MRANRVSPTKQQQQQRQSQSYLDESSAGAINQHDSFLSNPLSNDSDAWFEDFRYMENPTEYDNVDLDQYLGDVIKELPSNMLTVEEFNVADIEPGITLNRRKKRQHTETARTNTIMEKELQDKIDMRLKTRRPDTTVNSFSIAPDYTYDDVEQYSQYCPSRFHRSHAGQPCHEWPPELKSAPDVIKKAITYLEPEDNVDTREKQQRGFRREVRKQRREQHAKAKHERRMKKLQEQQQTYIPLLELAYLRVSYFFFRMSNSIRTFFRNYTPFKRELKLVQGKYGSGIAMFFSFAITLYLINFISVFLWTTFVVIPLGVHGVDHNEGFSFSDLVTGEGHVSESPMFLGSYPETPISQGGASYDVALAHMIVTLVTSIVLILLLSSALARRYQRYQVTSSCILFPFSETVFTTWDHTISDESSFRLQQSSISRELKDLIKASETTVPAAHWKQRARIIARRVLVNFVIVSILVVVLYVVVYLSQLYIDASSTAEELATPLFITACSSFLPIVFMFLARFEQFNNRSLDVKFLIMRSYLFRMASLYVLVVKSFNKAKADSALGVKCWETFTGQEMYKLVLTSTFAVTIFTFGGDFGRAFVNLYGPKYVCPFVARKYPSSADSMRRFFATVSGIVGRPEFQISKSTLDVIFNQTLLWTGAFFAPMLPIIGVFTTLLIFYAKYLSLRTFCQPPAVHFSMHSTDNFTIKLTVLSLFISLGPIGYAVGTLTPSASCGPYRGLSLPWDVISERVSSAPTYLRVILQFIGTAGFAVPLIVLLGLLMYYYRLLNKTSSQILRDLRRALAKQHSAKRELLTRVALERREIEISKANPVK